MAALIFLLEVISNLMRLLSLTIRLFANMLAGHLLILFMAGAWPCSSGCAAGLADAAVRRLLLFVFEVGLVAGLQAFIFATLTAIYLGGAVAEPLSTNKEPVPTCTFQSHRSCAGGVNAEEIAKAGKAIGLGVGARPRRRRRRASASACSSAR